MIISYAQVSPGQVLPTEFAVSPPATVPSKKFVADEVSAVHVLDWSGLVQTLPVQDGVLLISLDGDVKHAVSTKSWTSSICQFVATSLPFMILIRVCAWLLMLVVKPVRVSHFLPKVV
jgi:hypothetical protein